MDRTTILGLAVAVVAFIMADLVFVEVRRAVREAKRLTRRVAAYGGLPIFSLLASAEGDFARLTTALGAVSPLVTRARAAIAAIRSPFGARR